VDQDPTSSGVCPDPDGPATLDLAGRCVGSSYILLRPIGQGATGTVWRGVETGSNEPVAVKLLHESLLRQPKLVTRFVQERTILLMLRHRNVVRVRDLFSVGESLGLVMDLVTGGSLREHLRVNGPVPAGEAARLAAQLAAALAEAHDLGVVHRDLKPDNVLLQTENGRLETRLTDFGIARVLNMPAITTPHAVVGTPHYMAPEAFHGATASPAADVYALGILLYEMVTGRPPYDSDTVHGLMQRHLEGDPERRPGVPDELWSAIVSCLRQKPRLRPAAGELVVELGDVARKVAGAAALPPPESPESPAQPAQKEAKPPEKAPPKPEHISVIPGPRKPKSPRNRPPGWRWARPWTVLAVLAGAMTASGVATTAWHVTRSGASGGVTYIAASPAPRSGPPSSAPARPAATQTAAKSAAQAPERAAAAAPVEDRRTADPVRAAVPPAARPAHSPQPEARPYGPWNCRQVVTLDMRSPMLAKPCQSVGADVQMSGALTAPSGGRATITVALQESGRTVRGPYTCSGLVFTDDAMTHECGPRVAPARRGHHYTVLMTWSYTRDGRSNEGRASGSDFVF
jgi:serine/threonine protein kinase